MKLYNSTESGNCYKVRLLLAHLGLPYEIHEIDPIAKGPRPEAFRDKTDFGRVPLLILDDGRPIAESNAILWYLADGTPYLPDDNYDRTRVHQWLFFEQNLHECNIAVVRRFVKMEPEAMPPTEVMDNRRAGGHRALAVMDQRLSGSRFVAGDDFGIADISLFGYTHVAGEGGFDLETYRNVRRWIDDVRKQDGHVPMVG
ncbi:MAG: glutathione S-transferase family protein [Acidobacteriota bacterium]|nr:glutathione S-transferase family protein [Acidobacteriota bacterium]MDH3785595.1 glutathione S-transferase family protein [Acidobacteriota bacterium]